MDGAIVRRIDQRGNMGQSALTPHSVNLILKARCKQTGPVPPDNFGAWVKIRLSNRSCRPWHTPSRSHATIYLDLESDADRAKLNEQGHFLEQRTDKPVILDEVHRPTNLFQNLRGLIDRTRRTGKRSARFLPLGSASVDLLKQSGETSSRWRQDFIRTYLERDIPQIGPRI
ncbi:AAA family ATPase [Ensifer sp.]|uniref:AAA family ATPase n=1 Tax=Ensifer sp. TaxID=1872086 RepID=UPI0039C8BD30